MATDEITVRRAIAEDRARILEISSKIWEGGDYVPEVIDAWLADTDGELVVASLADQIIAFAHRTWLCPTIAWFEGIRTDPVFEGRGAAKAITRSLLHSVRAAGAQRVDLSTYYKNRASVHIIEAHGFQRVGTFAYLTRPAEAPLPAISPNPARLRELGSEETLEFLGQAPLLELSGGRVPYGWSFFPLRCDPVRAIEMFTRSIGAETPGRLSSILCAHEGSGSGNCVSLSVLDGDPEGMRALLDYALVLYEGRSIECMLPIQDGREADALSVLQNAGFRSWNEYRADVYVYERWL
jgi:RimJ/RimL family protein N-acetyltransferase